MLIKISKPECIWKTKSILGEGTLWVPKSNSIFFVDIKKKKIFILNTKTNNKKILKIYANFNINESAHKELFNIMKLSLDEQVRNIL